MKVMRTSVLFALLTTFVVTPAASAHEFWLQPEEFSWEPMQAMPLSLLVGHGDQSTRSTIPSRRVIRFEAIAPSGEALDLRGSVHPGVDTQLQFDAPGS